MDDIDDKDPDFIEFEFGEAELATMAEKAFPLDVVHLGTSLALRSGVVDACGDEIREKLRAMGFEWTESASSLTEEEMWPEWPGDSSDDDEDEENAEETGPAP